MVSNKKLNDDFNKDFEKASNYVRVKSKWQRYDPAEPNLPATFCLESSMHGLKYVGQRKLHLCERLLWLIAFSASAIFGIVLIYGMIKSYIKAPTVTVFHPLETSIDRIPFPGITVCNINRLQKSAFVEHQEKVLEWMEKLQPNSNLSHEQILDLAMMLDMNHLCSSTSKFTDVGQWDQPVLSVQNSIADLIRKYESTIDQYADPHETLRKVAQPCNKMILRCMWLEEEMNCEELFQEIETDFGHCCTFNSIPSSLILKQRKSVNVTSNYLKAWKDAEIDYENIIFNDKTISRSVPYRQIYSGRTAGLSVLLNPDLNEYFCSSMDAQGFILGVHVPIDYPRTNQKGIAINANSEVSVSIKPEVTLSDDSIAGFDVDQRNCYFGNEYKLPNFNTYTKSNCILECRLRRTIEYCNCAMYYMPQSNKTKICKPHMYRCISAVQRYVLRKGVTQECSECLPTCTEISYQKEVTQIKQDKSQFNRIIPADILGMGNQTNDSKNVSIVHIYLNTDSVQPKLRTEKATITDLISRAGGLLGLCVGFSVLSLLEALYYMSLRLYCSYKRDKTLVNNIENKSTAKLDGKLHI